MADGHEGCECIALAGAVGLRIEERLDKLRSIWDQRLRVLEDRSDSPHGVLADIGVAVIQAGACGREEGFNEFRFSELAQESQGVSSDVFVGVLKIVTDTVTAQKDRLLESMAYNVGMRQVPYQTRIISCFSLPFASSFGQIS